VVADQHTMTLVTVRRLALDVGGRVWSTGVTERLAQAPRKPPDGAHTGRAGLDMGDHSGHNAQRSTARGRAICIVCLFGTHTTEAQPERHIGL
jgi:hypothetical protein